MRREAESKPTRTPRLSPPLRGGVRGGTPPDRADPSNHAPPAAKTDPVSLLISSSALTAIIAHARTALPNECVGVLLGRDNHVQAAQVLKTSLANPREFEVDPLSLMQAQELADADGREIIGYYHSHPTGPAEPSARDRDCQLWPDLPPYYHVIVSLADPASPRVRAHDMRGPAWRELAIDLPEDVVCRLAE